MTQEAHQPSDAAMRFAVKWHSALGLDSFGVQILAKAYDEDVNTRTPDSVIAELVDAARDGLDALHSARAFILKKHGSTNPHREQAIADLTDALAKLEASK